MSKFEKQKVLPRYFAIAVVMTLVCLAVVVKAGVIMTAQKSYWETVASQQKRDSLPLQPSRGNILSCDGQLMASSLPEYKIYFDFQSINPLDTALLHKMDTLWRDSLESLCQGLHIIFPERSAEEFRKHLETGRNMLVDERVKKTVGDSTILVKTGRKKKGHRNWPIWPKRIDYNTYCEVCKLPYINAGRFKSGFHAESFNSRRRPFGSLASRTVGDLFGAKDSARFGLELSYDSILRGTKGMKRRQKVLDKVVDQVITPAIDGADIVTTIDVSMQDLAERAVVDELKEICGEMGVAIVMEVQTGDVKAIVNMERGSDGQYHEMVNRAVSYRCEPGSVFKVASFLVALDDGVVDTSYVIHTGCGIQNMHGRPMKDHNWRRGGYQDITVARALEVSSNIGVSHVIDHFYGQNPTKYVEGLYRVGIHEDLQLPIQGYQPPSIRMPDTKTTNRALYWSKTTLAWMSIGYETQIAPINTLTFYNAIANNGRMMRPRFVKRVVKDGQTLMEYEPQVIKPQIAKPKTIATMQTILEHVVSQGLGRKAGSRNFKVAGKTGTAQIADQYGGYHSGVTRYWLSFAGYFPADNPRYSCIVCLKKSGLPASGGGMSGVVFHNIAEGVMAHDVKMRVEDARDTTSIMVPDVKSGNLMAADYVLRQLDVRKDLSAMTTAKASDPLDVMPDVTGMGARDAVFTLERRGIKVRLNGTGRVHYQSIPLGQKLHQGMICELQMK